MVEVTLTRAEIEPGKVDQLREWFEELQDREEEMVENLQDGNVFTEAAFIHSEGDTSYLYTYMESKDESMANKTAARDDQYEIDDQHQKVLQETLTGESVAFEPIGHFTNPALR